MDEDGYVFFKQRKKRVVKVSGVGVFPTEIEKLVESVGLNDETATSLGGVYGFTTSILHVAYLPL